MYETTYRDNKIARPDKMLCDNQCTIANDMSDKGINQDLQEYVEEDGYPVPYKNILHDNSAG
ncbi:hypothetical protein QTN47_18715 [Danxiaibacter flavus]|uniref:Uncharacterized protein n=1 Tax=Danxiaibacter flavus TaxID=3049108 RepID=A0ABV3ZIA3_9BACT|nr:hypothetical protein QNM32_18725 [Chitinophagaceae bacterium DXS]